MSKLASISGSLDRERKLLRDLNYALLVIEAASLGKAANLGYKEKVITNSKRLLLDFVNRLKNALEQEMPSTELQPLVHRIRSGTKPLDDWIEDLATVAEQLRASVPVGSHSVPTLEDLLSLLDVEFTEDLRRLYMR